MKQFLGLLTIGLVTTLALISFWIPNGNATATPQRILPPLPTITVTIPGPIRTILKVGPTKTVIRPGPTKTVTKVIRVKGPIVTRTQTIRPTPPPASTSVKKVTASPKPSIMVKSKTITQIKHDVQVKERTKEIAIGVAAFLAGILIVVLGTMLVYYLGIKKGEEHNVGFLLELRKVLVRKE